MGCGRELEEAGAEFCRQCMEHPLFVERNFAVWQYDRQMKKSVADFKYQGRTEYARFYVEHMQKRYGQRLLRNGVEALIPIPCSKKRKRYRGYNQAEVLTDELAKRLGIPAICALERKKDTAPQSSLSPKERRRNLTHAFAVRKRYCGKLPQCVALVDDIYTTGATMNSCAELLLQSGVKKVFGICICIGADDV